MVRMAIKGVIDFSKADPHNKTWRLRYKLLLREFLRQENLEVLKTEQEYLLGLLTLTIEDKQDLVDAAVNTFNKIIHNVYPWAVPEKETQTQDIVQAFREKYGEEDDPRYQSLIKEWRTKLKEAKEKSKKER